MEKRFDEVLKMAEKEREKEKSFSYLPEIIELLKIMRSTLRTKANDHQYRKDMFSGLGRLVTEDFSFSESNLGIKILELANHYLNFDHKQYQKTYKSQKN